MRKKMILFALCALLAMVLTGCSLRSPEELYTLPRPSVEYENLQTSLEEQLQNGYEYAAPTSGSNTQSVQMEDLDGDGVDEAVAFFRDGSGGEHPLRICIFRVNEAGAYDLTATIEGDGDAISSVVYCQLNDHTDSAGHATEEIVVGWRVSGTVSALSAYSLENDNVTQVLNISGYTRYEVCDLDRDDLSEIVVLQLGMPEEGGNTADFYDWSEEDTMMLVNSTLLSASIESLESIQAGLLTDDVPALYVSGADRENSAFLITDILAIRDGVMTNITLDSETGDSATAHSAAMTLCDINGDGVLNIPLSAPLQSDERLEHSDGFSAMLWKRFLPSGIGMTACYTYHNTADGWYFILDRDWMDDLILNRGDINLGSTVERSITFYHRNADGEPEAFLAIYKNTGSNRSSRAVMGDCFLLAEVGDAAYSAELFSATWPSGLDREEVLARFSLITTDWSTD